MIAIESLASAMKKEFWSFFSTDAHKDMDLVRYINSARRYIVISKNFPFNKYNTSITTNWTDTEYIIPYQIETFFVLNSTWDEVPLYNFEDYYRLKDKTNAICIMEDRFVTSMIWTFQVFYRGYPSTITELTWNLNFPEHFFDLVVTWWTYYGFLDVKAYNKAGEKKAILDWMIKSMATRQSDKFPLQTKRLNSSKSNTW